MSLHGVGGSSSFHKEEPLRPAEGVTNEAGGSGGTQAAVNNAIREQAWRESHEVVYSGESYSEWWQGSRARQGKIFDDLINPNHQLESDGSFPTNLGHNTPARVDSASGAIVTGESGPTPPTALYKANADGHVTSYAVYNNRGEKMYTNDGLGGRGGSALSSIPEDMKKNPLSNNRTYQDLLYQAIIPADRYHVRPPNVSPTTVPPPPEPINIPPRPSGPEPHDLDKELPLPPIPLE